MSSETVATVEATDEVAKRHWLTRLFLRKWFRISLLVSIAAFEIFLTYFLKTNGWFATLDWGTQILVIGLAASPLLLALLFLAGRTFKLSSVFVALTLVGVFLALVIQPVLRAQKARAASLKFFDLKIQAQAESWHVYDGFRSESMWKSVDRERPAQLPEWIARLSGIDSKLFRDDQFKEVTFQTDDQLAGGVDSLKHCDNLLHVSIGPGITKSSLQQHLDSLTLCNARSFQFGQEYMSGIALHDLSKLDGNPRIKQLYLVNLANAFEQFSTLDLPNLEHVTFWESLTGAHATGVKTDWDLLFNWPRIDSLKGLGLNFTDLDNANARRLDELDNLESLFIYGGATGVELTDIGFVTEMKGLKELFIQKCPLTDESVAKLAEAKQLKWIVISGCGVSATIKGELEKALPDCNVVAVD